jgi:hypothetical protein
MPVWSSGQSSWLQMQRSCVRFPALPDFLEVVGLERGPLSLVRITEELLQWKSSGFGLENREYGRGDPLHWPRDTLYPQKFALTSQTSGGRSVGIVSLRTKATEFFLLFCVCVHYRNFDYSEGFTTFLYSIIRGSVPHTNQPQHPVR